MVRHFAGCGSRCVVAEYSALQVMADVILHGRSKDIDLGPFDPGRFTAPAKGRGRKMQDVPVGEQW
jgi:hypothetical protein